MSSSSSSSTIGHRRPRHTEEEEEEEEGGSRRRLESLVAQRDQLLTGVNALNQLIATFVGMTTTTTVTSVPHCDVRIAQWRVRQQQVVDWRAQNGANQPLPPELRMIDAEFQQAQPYFTRIAASETNVRGGDLHAVSRGLHDQLVPSHAVDARVYTDSLAWMQRWLRTLDGAPFHFQTQVASIEARARAAGETRPLQLPAFTRDFCSNPRTVAARADGWNNFLRNAYPATCGTEAQRVALLDRFHRVVDYAWATKPTVSARNSTWWVNLEGGRAGRKSTALEAVLLVWRAQGTNTVWQSVGGFIDTMCVALVQVYGEAAWVAITWVAATPAASTMDFVVCSFARAWHTARLMHDQPMPWTREACTTATARAVAVDAVHIDLDDAAVDLPDRDAPVSSGCQGGSDEWYRWRQQEKDKGYRFDARMLCYTNDYEP